jgi:hypothetical protein
MKRAGRVTSTANTRNDGNTLVGNPGKKKPLGRSKCVWGVINPNLQEATYEGRYQLHWSGSKLAPAADLC